MKKCLESRAMGSSNERAERRLAPFCYWPQANGAPSSFFNDLRWQFCLLQDKFADSTGFQKTNTSIILVPCRYTSQELFSIRFFLDKGQSNWYMEKIAHLCFPKKSRPLICTNSLESMLKTGPATVISAVAGYAIVTAAEVRLIEVCFVVSASW